MLDLQTTVVNGVPLRWYERGQGHPLVLVHGLPTSPSLWRYVVPLLEGRVLAWEMVGYGSSIPHGKDRDISVASQADYLLAWLDDLGIDRPLLTGHDLGGGVAQLAAVKAPERIAGIVLTHTISYDSWPIPSVKAMRALAPITARAPTPMFRALVATLIHRGHDDRRRAREALRVHIQPYLEHGGAQDMVRQVEALDVKDTLSIEDQLPSLDIPARIVWGEDDQFQRIEYAERLASDLNAPLQRIRGGKHFTPEDHPEVIAEAANAMLQKAGAA